MCIFNGIQFTRLVVAEMKQIFRSNSNVILSRQTCGQRSGIGCGWQTLCTSIRFSRANLLYVPSIEMYKRVGCRSVHEFGTLKMNASAQS